MAPRTPLAAADRSGERPLPVSWLARPVTVISGGRGGSGGGGEMLSRHGRGAIQKRYQRSRSGGDGRRWRRPLAPSNGRLPREPAGQVTEVDRSGWTDLPVCRGAGTRGARSPAAGADTPRCSSPGRSARAARPRTVARARGTLRGGGGGVDQAQCSGASR